MTPPAWILPFCLWSVIGFYVILIAYVVVRLRREKKVKTEGKKP